MEDLSVMKKKSLSPQEDYRPDFSGPTEEEIADLEHNLKALDSLDLKGLLKKAKPSNADSSSK